MKKITFLLVLLVTIIASTTFAQVAVNENGDAPNSKSILDVQSTTKGMLIPRMLTSERTTLGNTLTITEKGMLVYDTEQGAFYYFDGSGWNKIANFGSADDDWTVSGDNMYSAVSGDVGIGKTSNFLGKLDVVGKIYADNSSGDGLQVNLAGSPAIAPFQWWSSENNGLEINGVQGHGVFVGAADKSGFYLHEAAENGLYVYKAAIGVNISTTLHDGIYIDAAGTPSDDASSSLNNGIEIAGAEGDGVFVGWADENGLQVSGAAKNGLKIGSVGTPSTTYSTTDENAIAVGGAQGNGLYIGQADLDGVYVYKSNHDGIKVFSAGSPSASTSSTSNNGIEINGAEGHGVYVGKADIDGVHIQTSDNDGIYIETASNMGMFVNSATVNGLYLNASGEDAIKIYRAGPNPSNFIPSAENNGVEIYGAEGNGLFVGRADQYGVYVESAGVDGIFVHHADHYGVYANTTVTNGYGFYTNDKIYGSNLTSKSSSTYGLNTGNQSLRPGDVVCISGGMENNIEDTENLFAINLEKANMNNKQAVFGVVEYKVNIKTSINEEISADNQTSSSKDKSFAYIDGNINSGDYFSVIILGPAEVNVNSKTNIKVGDNVCIGNNGVSSQRVTEVNGISIAENVGILGKSMETASSGKMLVYVNCK